MPGRGTWAEFLDLAPRHAATLEAARALVLDVHPEAVEVVSLGERATYWGHGRAKMSESYAYAIPHKAHVNLGFFQGASLPDPEGRLDGTGKALRHVKLRAPADLADPALRALLLAARDERAAALS